jgi:hypothetical protein
MASSVVYIDIVLWAVYILLTAAIVAAIWSAVHGVLTHEKSTDPLASRRTSMIGYSTAGLVAFILLLTYLLASTQPVVSNGKPFADAFWLRLTDMFIHTSLLLICLCSSIIAIAKFRR